MTTQASLEVTGNAIGRRPAGQRGIGGPLAGILAAVLLVPAVLLAVALALRIVARAAGAALRLASAPPVAMAQAQVPRARTARYHHTDRSLVAQARWPHAAERREWRCPACQVTPERLSRPAYGGGSARPGSGSARRTSG